VLAPPGMQLVDRAPGTVGPQIVRQYRELPRLTENSIDAADDRRARDGDYRRYLSPWQANVVRQVGGGAVAPVLVLTLLLLAVLLRATRGLLAQLHRA
jgi:hypothetical protein